ncbi:hypothetical protein [Jiangella anatolica]|uniref:Uncharacterized protein n=1 Tax=Jiangella anatolica TaxID=2670374 RepID=A0A2W2BCR8_9ACTN|nr:hypothetical protein [Jiangella anatolica]PZF85431.1 hypothetical protein C1I92_04780 [Jiangella anatolica]
MTGDFDDELRQRLGGLSADLDGVALPGPAAARARAAQRTRHQVTSGVLAGVAAVAAGVLIVNPAPLTTTPEPAPPASRSTEAPTDPTTTPDDLSPALLTAGDVTDATGQAAAEVTQRSAVDCDPADVLARLSSPLGHAEVTYQAGDIAVRQDILRFSAAESVTGVWAEIRSCLPARGDDDGDAPFVTDDLLIDGVGDEGWLVRYYPDPDTDEGSAVTAALVRYQDVVSLTVRTEPQPDGPDADIEVPVTAARRMCDALFATSCVTDPVLRDAGPNPEETTEGPTGESTNDPGTVPGGEPTEPADPTTPAEELLELAEDPFLTDDDVAAVGTATGFVRQPELDPDAVWTPCLQNPIDSGAITAVALGYNHDLDASIVERVALMPDGESAFSYVAAHTTLPEVCGEVGEFREQTVGEPVAVDVDGADDAVAWVVESVPTAENPGSESSFAGIGIARVSNIVVVIGFSAMGDPSGGDWPGTVSGLLATALERAVG